MAKLNKLISYSFSFWDCGSLLDQEVLGHLLQLQESRLPGIDTIDDNVSVLILALFLGFILYTASKNKTPI
jgi:hypothetical protein